MWYYSALIIGLAGSLHCLGMCGPLAFALPVRTSLPWLKGLKYMVYNAGRITSYSLLGLLAGIIGRGFAFAGWQQTISVISGLLIILSAILVFHPGKLANALTAGISGKIRLAFGEYFKKSGWSPLFMLGILNGLLPCGMVYTSLIAAVATGGILSGSLFMAAFGLGTVPMMMAAGLTGSVAGMKGRRFFRRVTPVIACAIGILLILRGMNLDIPFISPAVHGHAVAKCH